MIDKKSSNFTKKLSIKQAFLWIFLSVCVVSGTSFFFVVYYQYLKEQQQHDPAYNIIAIVQTASDNEVLKTNFITELLDLSIDQSKNLYHFDTKRATEKLLELSVIEKAKVRKIRPGTIHVDYSLKKPVAYISDYTNTAIDASGNIFPFKPFYTPKKIPEIYLGEKKELMTWGKKLKSRRLDLALYLLQFAPNFCNELSSLSFIDVSNAFALSYGQRQVVISIEDRYLRVIDGKTILHICPRILRLREDNCIVQLNNYLMLKSYLEERDKILPLSNHDNIHRAKTLIIDLRLTDLAFLAIEP